MKKIYFILLMSFLSSSLIGKSEVDISIEYKNYENDTLLVAYHYADKILIQDTLYAKSKFKFEYKRDKKLEPGMYMLVTKPNNGFFQFLINEEDQEFKIKTDLNNPDETEIQGSTENEAFYDYIQYLSDQRIKLNRVDTLISEQKISEENGDKRKKDLADIVEKHQNNLIQKFQGSFLSMIIDANMAFVLPEFEGTNEEVEIKKYQYYKNHYLDGVDLSHPATIRSPFIHKKISFYLDNLTPIQADSIMLSLDYLLEKMEPAEMTFQYYLSHFLNKYGNSKYIGLDAVYVHLALKYYDKGLAPWVNEENLAEIVGNAKKMEPTLAGKTAPDFTVKQENGDPFTLSLFQAKYTVLIFWAPECGHCTKAMPYLVDFQEKYKDDGVRVVSICNQVGKKYETCWTGVKEKNMMTFLNTGDQYMKSRVTSKYFVRSTPMIVLMDEHKKILLKRIPAENMDSIMASILEQAEAEKMKG